MSMLIRDGLPAEDTWRALDDIEPAPPAAQVIVTLERWLREGDALLALDGEVGVRVPNTADLADIWPRIQDRPLLVLEFPRFGDGRAYSQARLLRERYGYAGEIRAVGDVLQDQVFYMQRCGFNALALRDDQDAQACLQALGTFSSAYQRAAGDEAPAHVRRRHNVR